MLTKEDITNIKDALTPEFSDVNSRIDGVMSEVRSVNSRLDAIEKDIKSVVRIYNLDEEMAAVYERLKRVEIATGIGQN